ncbi:MAG TPA: hypothetical protein VG479_03240 [Gaiellaceae bacterium]|jgi:hypothetical protein|nr:hypothetical protein [Gaiellaceae bacterium]
MVETRRSRTAWLAGLPLLAAGWILAHQLAYQLVPPDGDDPAAALAATGHGYLEHLPFMLGGLAALAAVGLLARMAEGRSGRHTLPAWLFGTVPLLAFAVQEHLERILHGVPGAWATAGHPVFLVGILLQLPFGLAAALAARALLKAADVVARGRELPRPRRPAIRLVLVPRAVDPAPVSALARPCAGRAPPALR